MCHAVDCTQHLTGTVIHVSTPFLNIPCRQHSINRKSRALLLIRYDYVYAPRFACAIVRIRSITIYVNVVHAVDV